MWRNPAFRISWMSYLWPLCRRISGRDRQLKSPCSSVSLIEPQLTRRQPQSCDSLSHCTLSSSTQSHREPHIEVMSETPAEYVSVNEPGTFRLWDWCANSLAILITSRNVAFLLISSMVSGLLYIVFFERSGWDVSARRSNCCWSSSRFYSFLVLQFSCSTLITS